MKPETKPSKPAAAEEQELQIEEEEEVEVEKVLTVRSFLLFT